jgi:hypothetical protein
MLEAILRLARDAGLCRRLGAGARRRIDARGFTWRDNARRIAGLFKEGRGAVESILFVMSQIGILAVMHWAATNDAALAADQGLVRHARFRRGRRGGGRRASRGQAPKAALTF